MNVRAMKQLTAHYAACLGQDPDEARVIHPTAGGRPHIDLLVFEPTEALPFWKLFTLGASDYRMRVPKGTAYPTSRAEYMMCVDKGEDLYDMQTVSWYYAHLGMCAIYPRLERVFVSVAHTVDFNDPDDEMAGVFYAPPVIPDEWEKLFCHRLSAFRTVYCLLAVTLTREELDRACGEEYDAFRTWIGETGKVPGFPRILSQRSRTADY